MSKTYKSSPTLQRNTRINVRVLKQDTGAIVARIPTIASLAVEAADHLGTVLLHTGLMVDWKYVEPHGDGPAVPFPYPVTPEE